MSGQKTVALEREALYGFPTDELNAEKGETHTDTQRRKERHKDTQRDTQTYRETYRETHTHTQTYTMNDKPQKKRVVEKRRTDVDAPLVTHPRRKSNANEYIYIQIYTHINM